MADKTTTLPDVMRLRRTWKQNNWNSNELEENAFEAFCNIFPYLEEDEKELIHQLTEKFRWLSLADYQTGFAAILRSMDTNRFLNCKTIYLFPIVDPKDDGKIKSGGMCTYILRGLLAGHPFYQNISIKVIDNYFDFSSTIFQSDGTTELFLIDDFIGTGDTFKNAWQEIKKNTTVNNQYSHILTLLIQEEGYQNISKELPIYYWEKRGRGIRDNFTDSTLEHNIRVMERIEKRIKAPKSVRFGYKGSEALVSLIRTPNNTFPFFWKKYKLKEEIFFGPFYRP